MSIGKQIAIGSGVGLGTVALLAIFFAYHTTGMAMAMDVLSWCF